MSGTLYLVPTPIGNLKDMTFRAIETLKGSDLILAEDTRNSGILLKHYEISTPMRSYHAHNEHKVTEDLIRQLQEGKVFSLITDAGSPGISDPGYLLAKACVENGVEVIALPGATAFVPALTVSGNELPPPTWTPGRRHHSTFSTCSTRRERPQQPVPLQEAQ